MTSPKLLPVTSASSDVQLTGGATRPAGPFYTDSATTHGMADTAPGNDTSMHPAPARFNFPQLASQEQLDRETRRERIVWLVQDTLGAIGLFAGIGAAFFIAWGLQ